MTFLHTLLLAVALLTSMQERLQQYRMQLNAYALYERHDYREAERAFEELGTHLQGEKEKTAAAFNQACALYMQGKFPDAATLFAQSAKSGGKFRDMHHKAIFNEGNALAMKAIGNSSKSEKTLLFQQSLNRFKTVLLTNPGDGDAKLNYEIVRRYLQELQSPEKNSSPPPTSNVNNSVANRLLENAQQDESSLIRRPPPAKASAGHRSKNEKDW